MTTTQLDFIFEELIATEEIGGNWHVSEESRLKQACFAFFRLATRPPYKPEWNDVPEPVKPKRKKKKKDDL